MARIRNVTPVRGQQQSQRDQAHDAIKQSSGGPDGQSSSEAGGSRGPRTKDQGIKRMLSKEKLAGKLQAWGGSSEGLDGEKSQCMRLLSALASRLLAFSFSFSFGLWLSPQRLDQSPGASFGLPRAGQQRPRWPWPPDRAHRANRTSGGSRRHKPFAQGAEIDEKEKTVEVGEGGGS
jgi:hypothetical protein